jgi:hypothetical protein
MLGKQRKGERQRKPLFRAGRRVSGFVLMGGKKLGCMGRFSHCGYLPGTLEQLQQRNTANAAFEPRQELLPSQRLVLDILNEGFRPT